jgi:hypothetical protein
MSLWGNLTSAEIPKYYGNTSDVFAVNVATEQANTEIPHCGWVVERKETAGLILVVSNTGTGYLVNDTLTFTGGNTDANAIPAAGYVNDVSNTGGVLGVTLTEDGEYFTNTAPTIGITSANASANGAVITATVGTNGRIGRTYIEVLVAGSFSDTTAGSVPN